ncbi:hypothetical protein V6N13_053647 [Hibiscus sabdariffa]|uniref:RNase H type-1 domain-containing protein n=1 Tax=Hibiscus sabdariffa TaxID=183260 RepID=A0ABR2T716_9ROSI
MSNIHNLPLVLKGVSVEPLRLPLVYWIPLISGSLKFNVNGAVLGGILIEHVGQSLIIFSKSTVFVDGPTTELLTVKEALNLFIYSRCANSHSLYIESNCSNVVSWFQRPRSTPSSFKQSIDSCISTCAGCDRSVVLVPRECNGCADILAKRRINRHIGFESIWHG